MEERKVVVKVRYLVCQDEEDDNFVCRFTGLGLVTRRETEEEAIRACKQLFLRFVESYRESGQLEHRLAQSEVEWYWLDEYPSDEAPPEFVGEAVLSLPTLEKFRAAMVQEGDSRAFAMAA